MLLIAGTHGNEINAPWLFKKWRHDPDLIRTSGLMVAKVLGNPKAIKACKRYLTLESIKCHQVVHQVVHCGRSPPGPRSPRRGRR